MRAALLVAPGKIEIATVETPHPAAEEVLIEPIRFVICGSDVSLYKGHRQVPLPLSVGHEVVGRLVERGTAVHHFADGQRVIVEPNYPCGSCRYCRSGRGNICPDKISMGVTAPGAAAEKIVAPAEFVWPIPDSISDEDAATIEPLAVALHAVVKSRAQRGDTVAVMGCGAIGLLIAHVAVDQGMRVLAYDLAQNKLAMALKLGAECLPNKDLTTCWHKENVTSVFECTGVAAAVESCIAAAPRGSEVILLGLCNNRVSIVPFRLVREGIQIATSLIYDHPADFHRAMELVACGKLKPSTVVTHTFPFASTGDALELACTGKAGKIHVTM